MRRISKSNQGNEPRGDPNVCKTSDPQWGGGGGARHECKASARMLGTAADEGTAKINTQLIFKLTNKWNP